MIAACTPGRLGGALGVSLLAHAALLGALGSLPAAPEARQHLAELGDRLTATLREMPAEKPSARAGTSVPAPRALPLVPAPRYYAADELDERPLILAHVEPRWPGGFTPAQGHVRLRLYLSEAGAVETVAVLDSHPSGAFDAAAREAFAAARFRPGMRGGAPVKSLVTLELLFGASLPVDPRATRSAESERAVPANPNAFDAPDRAGIKVKPPRHAPLKETS